MSESNQPCVLIADDDKDLTDLLALRCGTLGLTVEKAHDAMAAMQKINDCRPDVVILDVNMPSVDGLSVCEMMSHHLLPIPVIILSREKNQNVIRRCHNMCAYYVPKCNNVWERMRPLLNELLNLLALDDRSSSGTSEITDDKLAPALDEAVESMSSIDRVFALFGWNDEFLEDEADDRPTKQVDRPWVLCIDDDSDFTFTLQARLEQHGIEVLRAFAGMDGYRYAFTSSAQLIILDYEMPNGNGDYVLRRLKENPVTKDIPVIVLTGRKEKTL